MEIDSEKILFIPDLHGHAALLKMVLKHYSNESPTVVSLGDVFDGYESPKETLDLLIDNNVTMIAGNHEIAALAAIRDNSDDAIVRRMWLRIYERNTLQSYGLYRGIECIDEFEEKLKLLGHLAYLENAPLYIETPSIIAVHAGLKENPWPDQRAELDGVASEHRQGIYDSDPIQIFDYRHELSTKELSTATNKLVVSGHAHNRKTSDLDISREYNRIKLASNLGAGAPLFVWESWTKKIVSFSES